ncbi:MAG: tryptophan synthase subunit alpha [Chloroflexota bacterium]
MEHIQECFARLREQGRPACMPYFTLGFPTPGDSLAVIRAIAAAGADLIELGVPFSDPLADGPTIQRSTQQALAQGMRVAACLEMARKLRAGGVTQPLLLMGYLNPLLSYGIPRFVAEAAQAGVDGLIVPDLPPEDAAELEAACQAQGCALVYLLAPNSTPERIRLAAARSTGFIYLVSVTGVTGARQALPAGLVDFIQRVRAASDKPLAVGFGISTPEQAAQVGALADGVIVGSALIEAVEGSPAPAQAAAAYVGQMREALGQRRGWMPQAAG